MSESTTVTPLLSIKINDISSVMLNNSRILRANQATDCPFGQSIAIECNRETEDIWYDLFLPSI